MRHHVGESQDTDELVLELPDEAHLNISPRLSHDGRWLAVHLHEGTSTSNRLWVYPVSTDGGASSIGEPVRLVDEAYAGWELVRSEGSRLYLLTDHEAPRRRVVRVDLDAFTATGELDLLDVVPESEHLLQHVKAVGRELLVVHLVDVQPRLSLCTLDGTLTDVGVHGGEVVALHGEVDDDEVFVGLSSVTERVAAYRLGLGDGTLARLDQVPAGDTSWQPPRVVTERRRATSQDGTEVPYFLVRRADLPEDGPRPTLLWGYGGFDQPMLATYRPEWLGWLAAGGVLAIANLRGGGEFGTAWHDGGRLERKQNVFDDFTAVARHLVEEGVTTPGQLALNGRSNGGLLIGATVAQHPDLAAVALPGVGVMDMLRYHLFTIGAAWASDYGSPEDPEMFEVLRAYSPLHNLQPGRRTRRRWCSPATTTTGWCRRTASSTPPSSSTAGRQRAGAGPHRDRRGARRRSGSSTVVVEETTDLLAFAAEHTGLVPG